MRIPYNTLRASLLLAIFCLGASAQKIAVLATGSQSSSDFVPFSSKADFRGFSRKGFAPGAEVIFGPRGRVGGGFMYQRQSLAADPVESVSQTGSDVRKLIKTQQLNAGHLIGSLLYINLSPHPTEDMVVPFVGAGTVLTLVRSRYQYASYLNGVLDPKGASEGKRTLYGGSLRFVGGANVFPSQRVMASAMVGHQYRAFFFQIRGGFVF